MISGRFSTRQIEKDALVALPRSSESMSRKNSTGFCPMKGADGFRSGANRPKVMKPDNVSSSIDFEIMRFLPC